jgi:hypothetical protein
VSAFFERFVVIQGNNCGGWPRYIGLYRRVREPLITTSQLVAPAHKLVLHTGTGRRTRAVLSTFHNFGVNDAWYAQRLRGRHIGRDVAAALVLNVSAPTVAAFE